jgi:hypothetical protein
MINSAVQRTASAGITLLLGACLLPACSDNSSSVLDSGDPGDSGGQVDATGPVGDLRIDASSAIPASASTVATLLANTVAAAPQKGSDAYTRISTSAAVELRAGLKALLAGDQSTAMARAATASYTLCLEGDVVLWRSTVSAGHAALALRLGGSARPVLVGVPHAIYDLGTPGQGLQVFEKLKARGLALAGAHRCSSKSASGCSRSTGVCGTSGEPYRLSDAAHAVDTAFQIFHEVLLADDASLVAISLHGMSGLGVSLSDGTTGAAASGSHVAQLAPLLAKAFPGDLITSCNLGAGVPHQLRLCGTTNVQGRLANGAASPCTDLPSGASGRFIHLEQSKAVRAQAALVAAALDQVL